MAPATTGFRTGRAETGLDQPEVVSRIGRDHPAEKDNRTKDHDPNESKAKLRVPLHQTSSSTAVNMITKPGLLHRKVLADPDTAANPLNREIVG